MIRYQISLVVFITSMILLMGFKKNTLHPNFLSAKSINKKSRVAELPKVIIVDATAIQGDKGERPLEVLICLSEAASEPVTVEYNTENGSGIAGVDYVATKGSIRFEPGEITRWVTVSIIGEVAADPDENATAPSNATLKINLNKVVGAIIEKKSAIITIIKNILHDPRYIGANKSVYEVHIKYTGYTTLGGDLTNCPIRRNGKVELWGILTGYEKVGRYDPVLYTGPLTLWINMDICSVERLSNGDDKFCGMTVGAFGEVMTELEIDSSAGYGYIKIHYDPTQNGQFVKRVGGKCYSQIAEETQMVPNKSISSIFNGKELPMLIDVASGRPLQKLKKGVYSETDPDGNVTTVEVTRKIR